MSFTSASTQDVQERAERAVLRLRVALQHVEASRLAPQRFNAASSEAVTSSQHTRGSLSPSPSTAQAPQAITLEWPLAPLLQRAREKKAREGQRQRRRAARQAAAAAVASSMSAAEVMRNTLSQPLGVMAARLLSAATAGAPSLFSDPGASGRMEATGQKGVSPNPAHLSPPSNVAKAASANPPVGAAAAPANDAHGLLPSDSPSPLQRDATLHRIRHRHNHRYHAHHHRRTGSEPLSPLRAVARGHSSLLAMSTTSLSPRPERGTSELEWRHTPQEHRERRSTSLASLRPDTLPTGQKRSHRHRRHHHHIHRRHQHAPHGQPEGFSSKPITLTSGSRPEGLLSAPTNPRSTPTSVPSTTHALFGNSPLSILARTFGAGSPTHDSDHALCASLTRWHGMQPTNARALDQATASGGSGGSPGTFFPSSSSPTVHDLPRPHSALSSPGSCSCSHSSYSEWDGSAWTPSDASGSFSGSSDSIGDCPLTAPGPGGQYDPCAQTPSVLRCYGGAETHGCLSAVSSTSTQRTESRSSTPFSSEWSAGSSSASESLTRHLPRRAGDGPACTSNHPPLSDSGGDDGGVPAGQRAEESHPYHGSGRKRDPAPPRGASRHSFLASPTAQTQFSFATEMDAIEKGHVAPYMSYLFTPEARVVDLRQLEGQLRRREPPPPISATCIRFSHAGDAYLVGTSSGLLWRVPVGGGQEAVRATPLGSLWPPLSQTSMGGAANGGGINGSGAGSGVKATSASFAAGCTNAATTATSAGSEDTADGTAGLTGALAALSASASPLQPIPLSGHTAAILSIAFNDDGSLYATTGLDGCVIVWKASTSAKLRRISAIWANNASTQRAPYLVRFMPQNNNYLLVSYVESSELHLYNSSTGLPVTNVAGTGLTRTPVSGGSSLSGGTGLKHSLKSAATTGGGGGSSSKAMCGSAITALAVSLIASPFFVSGDADGTVMLWTYRAGDLVMWPTLRATSPPTHSGTGGSGGGGAGTRHARSRSSVVESLGHGGHGDALALGGGVYSTPLYQLPELRRVAACSLPAPAGGVAAISVSTLHAAQLHSLFRPCGSQHSSAASARHDGKSAESARVAAPHHPLEATAQILHAAAAVNRACREEFEARKTEEEAAAAAGDAAGRSRREGHAKGSGGIKRDGAGKGGGGADERHTNASTSGGGGGASGFPHVLAGLPSRLSDTFSALWGGGSSHAGHSESVAATAHSSVAPLPAPSTSVTAGNTVSGKKEMLRKMRSDALDVVCPLLILVTAPCDTVYSLGLLLQLHHSNASHGSTSSGAGSGGVARPTVSYRLYPLLKTTGPSRMRHVGVGAVPSPDNRRLVVVAAPCEEGFVRVLPLLRLEPATALRPEEGATVSPTASGSAARVNKKHVLATLPMPYGGRCTGIAWSPSGRFLVAITAEGVIYQWSRVYLLDTAAHAHVHRGVQNPTTATAKRTGVRMAGRSSSSSGGLPAHAAALEEARRHAASGARAAPAAARDAAVAAAVKAAARRRGCDTEYSDTVHQPPSALNFSSLLGTAVTAPTGAAVVARESDAARAAFSEEDAWRESLQRELERQRREQAALKLVTQPGVGDEDEVSSSGYWLNEDRNSEGSRSSFVGDEETEPDDATSSL